MRDLESFFSRFHIQAMLTQNADKLFFVSGFRRQTRFGRRRGFDKMSLDFIYLNWIAKPFFKLFERMCKTPVFITSFTFCVGNVSPSISDAFLFNLEFRGKNISVNETIKRNNINFSTKDA